MNGPISKDHITFVIEHSIDSVTSCNFLFLMFENMREKGASYEKRNYVHELQAF